MANYVKATNFTAKDALPQGNAGKIVKGTELDTEFTAIASAVSSKADLNSPSLTGTPTAPTATIGTNTTQLATTAFVTAGLQAAYPIGSIYMNATNASNPSSLLGFGTWSAFGAGRMPVGFNSGDTLFDTAEETGGSKDAIVVSHTHTATSVVTDSGHLHGMDRFLGSLGGNNTAYVGDNSGAGGTGSQNTQTASTGITVATTNSTTGSSGTNANLPPYITVYMWKRTA